MSRSRNPILIATLLIGCASAPPPPSEQSALLHGIVPSFTADATSGRRFQSGEFYGRTSVISIVSDGCKPCDQSLAAAQAMYADMHDVSVVGVFRGDLPAATKVAEDLGLRFPMVGDADGRIARKFGVDDVPMTFVADSQGRVAWVGGPDMTEEALTSAVRSVR